MEAITQPDWSAFFASVLVVTLTLVGCGHALFWRPPKKKTFIPKRSVTLRINEGPIHKSKDVFICDLEDFFKRDSVLNKDEIRITHSFLAKKNEEVTRGTATFDTSIPASVLIERLSRNLPYEFDANFVGFTLLYDACENADVEWV
jgi:hypothetical protein